MLTAIAILERELGRIVYEANSLERRLLAKRPKAEADRIRQQLRDLEGRKAQTIRLLDDQRAEYEERTGAHAA